MIEPDDSSWDFDDDFDEGIDDCGIFPDCGFFVCSQIGSEPCEFCPNRLFLGTRVETTP